MVMIKTEELIALDFDISKAKLNVGYSRQTERTIFDICDLSGRIVKTGKLESDETVIPVKELENSHYIFLILDGDQVISRKFCMNR